MNFETANTPTVRVSTDQHAIEQLDYLRGTLPGRFKQAEYCEIEVWCWLAGHSPNTPQLALSYQRRQHFQADYLIFLDHLDMIDHYKKTTERGLRILSFDGDGPGCLSQLLILQAYIYRLAFDLKVDPDTLLLADLVDMMGGAGFGGWVALLLGRLRLPVTKALDELLSVGQKVFPSNEKGKTSPEERTRRLKAAIEDTLRRYDIPLDATLYDAKADETACKVVVLGVTNVHLSHCRLFRTYSSRQLSFNCTLVEAACATPSLFAPVSIGLEGMQENFIGASIGFNNPTQEILNEVRRHFGNRRLISHILSIGAGRAEVTSLDLEDKSKDHSKLLSRLVGGGEKVARDLSNDPGHAGVYLRLNVDQGMENIRMEDWDRAGMIKSHTDAYLGTPSISNAVDVSLGVMYAESKEGATETTNNEYNYHIWRTEGYARSLPFFFSSLA